MIIVRNELENIDLSGFSLGGMVDVDTHYTSDEQNCIICCGWWRTC